MKETLDREAEQQRKLHADKVSHKSRYLNAGNVIENRNPRLRGGETQKKEKTYKKRKGMEEEKEGKKAYHCRRSRETQRRRKEGRKKERKKEEGEGQERDQ